MNDVVICSVKVFLGYVNFLTFALNSLLSSSGALKRPFSLTNLHTFSYLKLPHSHLFFFFKKILDLAFLREGF